MDFRKKSAVALVSLAVIMFYGALLYASCLVISAVLTVLAGIVWQAAAGSLPDVSVAAVWLQSAVPVWAVLALVVLLRVIRRRKTGAAPKARQSEPPRE